MNTQKQQIIKLATIIDNLSSKSDFRLNEDGTFRYPDDEIILGRDNGNLTRGDIRFARSILDNIDSL